MTEAIAIIEQKPMPILQLKEQIGIIQKVMSDVMQKDVHYGVIPGCKQPSLYKAGAEKIAVTFHLSVVPVKIEDLSTSDCVRYRITEQVSTPDGRILGGAVGEASSDEEKYKWRKPVCQEEYADTPDHLKREKWCAAWNNKPAYKQKQIKTDPATQANTILQMADKRAYVAAVRRCTAASDVFTQDIQDLPPEYLQEDENGHAQKGKPEVRPPQEKNTQPDQTQPRDPLPMDTITPQQQKKIFAMMSAKKIPADDFKAWLLETLGLVHTSEIFKSQMDDVIQAIETWGQA